MDEFKPAMNVYYPLDDEGPCCILDICLHSRQVVWIDLHFWFPFLFQHVFVNGLGVLALVDWVAEVQLVLKRHAFDYLPAPLLHAFSEYCLNWFGSVPGIVSVYFWDKLIVN